MTTLPGPAGAHKVISYKTDNSENIQQSNNSHEFGKIVNPIKLIERLQGSK